MSADLPTGRPSDQERSHGAMAGGSANDGAWRSRPSLTVWSYDTPRAAAAGTLRFGELVRSGSVSPIDAVTAMWVPGSHRPWIGQLRQTGSPRSSGPLGAALIGLARVLLGPERLDDEFARVADALAGTGVDVEFLQKARSLTAPPRSTLMVLSAGVDLDVVRPVVERGLSRGDVVLLHALLREDSLEVFREALNETGLREGADGSGEPAGVADEMTARFEHDHPDQP